jgi:hypothetical protein
MGSEAFERSRKPSAQTQRIGLKCLNFQKKYPSRDTGHFRRTAY